MADKTIEDHVGDMTGPSNREFEVFASTLRGVGAEALTEWKAVQSATSAMVTDGRSAADKIAKLRADTTLPRDHRFDGGSETAGHNQGADWEIPRGRHGSRRSLEGELAKGLLPKPGADSGQRMLARETRSGLSSATGQGQRKCKR